VILFLGGVVGVTIAEGGFLFEFFGSSTGPFFSSSFFGLFLPLTISLIA